MTGNGEKIRCRTRASTACYDGTLSSSVYGQRETMEMDGTYDGTTVCCDACYIKIGSPSIDINDPAAAEFVQRIGTDGRA